MSAVVVLGLVVALVASCGGDDDAAVDASSDASRDGGRDAGGANDAGVDAPRDASTDAGLALGLALDWAAGGTGFTFASPRARDLDGDGVLDVVTGTGVEARPGEPGAGALTALDGSDGSELWQTTTAGELVGSPSFVDRAGLPPLVVIGGREETLVAVDGATGDVVWAFAEPPPAGEPSWFSFFTPLVVPDLTSDGIADLVVACGGDNAALPFAPRRPGHVLVVDGADGALVATMQTPDLAETYMSPLARSDAMGELEVIFGTGGETLPGSLYRVPLAALLAEDATSARSIVAPLAGKGMIAPPALVDLDGDALLDVVVATFDGRLVAVAAADDAVLWTVTTSDAESYMSPAIGRFDADAVPDVAGVFSRGTFPDYVGTTYLVVSGATGEVLHRSERDEGSAGSPLALDVDGDGRDEALVPATRIFDAMTIVTFDATMRAPAEQLVLSGGGLATPMVTDLDGDGGWDLVLPRSVATPAGPTWIVERRSLPGVHAGPPSWGAYLGPRYDGTY